jgi:hypothetical protein
MKVQSVQIEWPGRRMEHLPVMTLRWADNDALRCNGAVSLEKSLTVVPNRQYADLISQVLESMQALINDAYEDYRESNPTPGQVDEDEEDKGMGDD